MTSSLAGQESLFARDTWCGRTSPERSAATKAETSRPCSRKRSASSNRKPPVLKCLQKAGLPGAGIGTWTDDGAWLGEYTMRNTGECPSVVVESRLSQILEVTPHTKYSLSARACQGILRRAARRGKDLPEMLKQVLLMQSASGGGCDGGGKGALIQTEKSGTLGTGNDQTIFQGVTYGICSYASNSMMSGNPHSGIYEADTSRTLDLNGGNPACNQAGIAVVQQVFDMTHACDVIRECGDIAPSLQARMGTGGNQIPLTYQMQGFGDYRQADVSSACKQRDYKDSTDLVVGLDGECNSYTEQYGTLRAHTSGDAEETVMSRCVVRRLTPLECERLQGFPDGWTDIGDYTDSTGKKRKTSDSARYKALGNSIALPFWRWMFGRMAAYLPEGATLGSLFDGIGGFPLCWEDVHGIGTAIWASEIEEFPIAVTKKRFGGENMIHYTLNVEPPVEPPEYTCPRCPVCDAETDKLLRDRWGNIVGCPECVKEVDAWTL